MVYKDYRIMATQQITQAFPLNDEGDVMLSDPITLEEYEISDYWFAIVDDSNYVVQSFETIEECKEYIDEEE